MATREQLQFAAVQITEQEQYVEILQLTLLPILSNEWQPLATLWCQQVIPQLQQNAVLVDSLLEQMDEGKDVEASQIPQTPAIYNRLLVLEQHKDCVPNYSTLYNDAIESNNELFVDLLLQHPSVDPSEKNNEAIRVASAKCYLAIVERLLQDPRVDPSTCDNCAIRLASTFGHLAVVDRLLQDHRVDPSDNNNDAIRWASTKGHLAVVDRLLQDHRMDPSADNNWAIRIASEYGHLDIVDRLLQDPRVDPSVENNWAIRLASRHGHLAVVNRLLQDSRVDPSVLQTKV
jgi:Ankyrin repeats (3 copies)